MHRLGDGEVFVAFQHQGWAAQATLVSSQSLATEPVNCARGKPSLAMKTAGAGPRP
ncbi:hypothetical protein MES5069_680002 [Mesorhizobium escarrei]|uniref:Uncharacterized protein n=1 Tax=Mesorhizobium escarrei TaxID=666018 RepID=A0ABN8KGH6_9HYPH|nr:hypothetical protein MES5069_680002 [Mesorhizobium escarrei]